MQIEKGTRPLLYADGVVRRVDPVGRELHVVVAGTSVNFNVGPECIVTLRGERVKLRMIQPQDRVRLAYTGGPGALVAAAVEVQAGGPAPPEPAPGSVR
jgi:hypothetical protein